MADPHKLRQSEKALGFHTSERSRDKAAAGRAITGLTIEAQQLDHMAYQSQALRDLVNAQIETNRLLGMLVARLDGQRTAPSPNPELTL